MKFNDFVGNEKVLDQLESLLKNGRFPHAVLIEGEEGSGKKTLARDIACALVCRSENKPCMQCSQCRKAREKLHPDIFEYIPSGGANSFHVETVRDVINDAYIKPNEADYKIYILAEADCMNTSAQNALLKILEEPPSYVVFILTAKSKSAMLSTVLSRCVTVNLEGVDIRDGAKRICTLAEDVDYDTARKTLEIFNGNIGRALNSLNDSKTTQLVQVCDEICRGLVEGSEYAALTACSALQRDRQAVVFVCDMLKSIFRDALVCDGDEGFISGRHKTVRLLRSRLSRKKLFDLLQTCEMLKKTALMNVNNALIITKICYSLFSC